MAELGFKPCVLTIESTFFTARLTQTDHMEWVGSWEDGLLSQVWEGCVQEQGFGLEEYVALGP